MDSRILQYFCSELKQAIRNLGDNVTEIRLRKNAPMIVMIGDKRFFATSGGCLTSVYSSGCIKVTEDALQRTFEAVCRYSVHSYYENICSGFITLDGGHRVGICGTAVIDGGTVKNVKNISSLNFRVAHSVKGCADKIFKQYLSVKPCNLLIAGAPARGKTTLLRDLCRCIGNQYKLSVIDSRGELAAVYNGVPQNDVGINTDVFNGYLKSSGIETAVRVMSPDVIVCDELGYDDAAAVEYAALCGVKICTAVHGEGFEDIKKRLPFYKAFDVIIFLASDGRAGTISEVMELRDNNENIIDSNACTADNAGRCVCFGSSEKAV